MFRFSKLFVVPSYFLGWRFSSCTRRLLAVAPAAFPQVAMQRSACFLFDCQLRLGVQLVCCRNCRSVLWGWSLHAWHCSQIVYILLFCGFLSHKTEWPGCSCIPVCFKRHCPMFIISQDPEVWVEQSPSRFLTSCTVLIAKLAVFVIRIGAGSWSLSTGCRSLLQR